MRGVVYIVCEECEFLTLSDFSTLCAVQCPSYAAGVTPAGDAKIAPVG